MPQQGKRKTKSCWTSIHKKIESFLRTLCAFSLLV